ncbi:MAG: hypothetical protein LC634_04570 [Sphingomonadales bacterium]|nr:hypothetical protein [Sphingomonadales bacterium]
MAMEFDAPGGVENGSDGCIAPASGLREEIAADPSAFVADIHTPDGTIAGTLER